MAATVVAGLVGWPGLARADGPGGFVRVDAEVVTGVQTSSAAPRCFASALTDGSVSSGWLSEHGDTLGATITVRFSGPQWVSRVGVAPGRKGADGRSFVRPAQITVRAGELVEALPLADDSRVQWLSLSRPVAVEEVTLVVDKVHGYSHIRVSIEELYFEGPRDVVAALPQLADAIAADVAALASGDAVAAKADLVVMGRAAAPALAEAARRCAGAGSLAALSTLADIDLARTRAVARELLDPKRPACAAVALDLLRHRAIGGVADELLRVALGGEEPGASEALARLAAARDARAVPLLERRLREGDAAGLDAVAHLLTRYGADGLEVLARAFDLEEGARREAAILSVARLTEVPEATTTLVALARRAGPADAGLAIRALGALEREDARAALRAMVAESGAHRSAALEALAVSGRLGDGNLEWIDWVDPQARERIVAALAETPTPVARQILVALVLTPRALGSRRSAGRALLAHGAPGFEALLAALVEDPSRIRYAYGYFEIAAASVADAVSKKVRHLPPGREHDELRMALLDMLGATGDPKWATVVYAVYTSELLSPRVREYALGVIAKLPSPEVARWIMSELEVGARDELTALKMQAVVSMGGSDVHERLFEGIERTLPGDWTPTSIKLLANVDKHRVLRACGERFRFATKRTQVELLEVAYRVGSREGLDLLFEAALSRDKAIRRRALAWLSLPLDTADAPERRRRVRRVEVTALLQP